MVAPRHVALDDDVASYSFAPRRPIRRDGYIRGDDDARRSLARRRVTRWYPRQRNLQLRARRHLRGKSPFASPSSPLAIHDMRHTCIFFSGGPDMQ